MQVTGQTRFHKKATASVLLALALGALFSLPCAAESKDADAHWNLQLFNYDIDYSGYKERDKNVRGWALTPIDESGPYVQFTCSRRYNFRAAIVTKPGTFRKFSMNGPVVHASRYRMRRGILSIDGEEGYNIALSHRKKAGLLETQFVSDATRLFEAAKAGLAFRLEVPATMLKTEVKFPPPDGQFEKFVALCKML